MSKKFATVLKGIAIWLPTVLLGLLFVMQGVMKLAALPVWIDRFRDYGYPGGFIFVVGVAELAGALLLFVPRTARFGGLLLGVVMLGAAGTHALHNELGNALFTFILACIFVALAWVRTPQGGFLRLARSS